MSNETKTATKSQALSGPQKNLLERLLSGKVSLYSFSVGQNSEVWVLQDGVGVEQIHAATARALAARGHITTSDWPIPNIAVGWAVRSPYNQQ